MYGKTEPRADDRGGVEPVCSLREGDIIRVGSEWMLVADEPLTMHRGLGLFDDFALLIEVEVRDADGIGPRRRLVLPADRGVLVVSRNHEEG
jgi:hypothetical protein